MSATDDGSELIVESLANGQVMRSPASSDEWILVDDDDVVDAEEKR
jgi:hypothetical protein